MPSGQGFSPCRSSSWDDYDRSLISAGGGVFPRTAQGDPALARGPRAAAASTAESLPPTELIHAILTAPVDLLWNGGIGTYVKASDETNADVGDRANDALRVDAADLRALVVGEGGNLGLTQRARIEYALAGGRVNTDAIDNSAGVDTSDHEVNIKVLLDGLHRRPGPRSAADLALLAAMTDDVAHLVLHDNERQNSALTVASWPGDRRWPAVHRPLPGRRSSAPAGSTASSSSCRRPRRSTSGCAAGQGLTRPELAVLLAYTKIGLYDDLLASALPDDPAVAAPPGRATSRTPLVERLGVGAAASTRCAARSSPARSPTGWSTPPGRRSSSAPTRRPGAAVDEIARAWLVATAAFDLDDLRDARSTPCRPRVPGAGTRPDGARGPPPRRAGDPLAAAPRARRRMDVGAVDRRPGRGCPRS